MLNKLTYDQRLKFLVAAAIIGLFLCYKFSISKTINQYLLYHESISTSKSPELSQISLQALNNKQQVLESLFNEFQLDSIQPDKNLLMVASDYSSKYKVKLKEYKPYSLSKSDSLQVLTRIITIEGPFNGCLQLLYQLETAGKVGKISSADFKSFTDPLDKKTKLNCSIYIQNLIPNNHEKD
jgi:hypothetical protein